METTPVREQKQPKNQQQDMGPDQEKFGHADQRRR
mgnify:CR=1 FL=1